MKMIQDYSVPYDPTHLTFHVSAAVALDIDDINRVRWAMQKTMDRETTKIEREKAKQILDSTP